MQRVTAAALLAAGSTRIENPSDCDDALSALGAAAALGATIERTGDALVVTGGLRSCPATIDCGESGLCLRMFIPIAALVPAPVTLRARGGLSQRPVGMAEPTLKQLGAECASENGLPPVRVCGPLRSGRADVDGSVSSQFLTGLLLALPRAEGDSTLVVAELKSRPYIDLTLETLAAFGVRVEHDDYRTFFIPGRQSFRPARVAIEGDWSGAAFLIAAAAVSGDLRIGGLRPASPQADRRILDLLLECGGAAVWEGDTLHVRSSSLRPFTFDATDCPDLFPPLVALACACAGTSRIAGVHRLRHKESDRASALVEEFGRIGVQVAVAGDWLEVCGGAVRGGDVDARGDHRIAMAAAVAGLIADAPVRISGSGCVAKSYPGFFTDLQRLGGNVD
jgi:3-phosphoshikimate 1-carboxyvinyltransferase